MILFKTKQNTLEIQICKRNWFIKNIDEKTNLKEISNKYNVSVFSIYKIVKDYNSRYIESNISKREIKTGVGLSLEEYIFIQNFIKPSHIPVTIQSINDEVNKVLELNEGKEK